MRILVLGGTIFLGRAVVEAALARGHEVTVFSRGLHGAAPPDGAAHVRGDREGDLAELRGGAWDAAIDTSGFEPGAVAASSALLAEVGAHLVFVSSASVYREWPAQPVDESSPLWTEGDDYGALKAACERGAETALPGRVAHVRAGLIVGPHDYVFRLPWWVRRIADGGDVVAPGDPRLGIQLVDARDLASWMVDLAERRTAGTFNATGPVGHGTIGELLDAAVKATGSDARLRWVPDEALVAAGVEPWTGLPLWLPAADAPGAWRIDTARAADAGLRCRPLRETVRDVWAWLRDGGGAELGDYRSDMRPTGLTAEQERVLLSAAPG